jgi:hypothetical protein
LKTILTSVVLPRQSLEFTPSISNTPPKGGIRPDIPGLFLSPMSDGKFPPSFPAMPFYRGDTPSISSPPLNPSAHTFSVGPHELFPRKSGKLQMIELFF